MTEQLFRGVKYVTMFYNSAKELREVTIYIKECDARQFNQL